MWPPLQTSVGGAIVSRMTIEPALNERLRKIEHAAKEHDAEIKKLQEEVAALKRAGQKLKEGAGINNRRPS